MTLDEASGRVDRRRRSIERIAIGAGAAAVLVGAAVLLGWALGVQPLKSVLPGYVSMKPNTALAFVFAGVSLLFRMRRAHTAVSRRLAVVFACAATLLALLNVAEYLLHATFGVDELLFRDTDGPTMIPPPGRMASVTAWCFTSFGLALVLLDQPRVRRLSGVLAGLGALLAATVVAGYAYNLTSPSPVSGYSSVAIHTAAGLLVLALGIACARPWRGFMGIATSATAGGLMARALIPAAIIAPPVFGWLCLEGAEARLYDPRFGVALFAVTNVLFFLALVAWNAVTLFRVDVERRAVQDRLRVNEEHLRLMVENMPVALAMLDREMRYLLVSPRWMSDFRLGERSIIGLSHYDVFPRLPESWKEVHRRCLAGADEICEEEALVRDDGGVEWIRREVHPWRDGRGEIGGIVIFAELTTQRKAAEEALKRSEEQLRQSQRMEAVGRLAGGVAHDFNNLLTVINGYGEMLLSSLPRESPQRESIKEIVDAGHRAAGLTGQLLAFSRKQVLDPKVVDLSTVLAGMEQMIRRLIGEDIDFEARFSRELWSTLADPGQMEQVVLNLAVNARDAMPHGGRLTLETRNVTLDEAYSALHPEVRAGDYVMVAVSDTGVGMDTRTRDRIFEPFFTTKEHGKGTGLGLATVYGIVKQSGGHIWLYSEPGQGATFKIYLPRVRAAAAPSRALPAVAEAKGGAETILVVEDDKALRRFMEEALGGRGYHVFLAMSGAEALEIVHARTEPIDLLVTDVVMPGMSGRAVADALQAARPGIKVLYISGYTENAIVHHGRLDPGVQFLAKPFGPDALARKVREVLDGPPA